MRVIYPNYRPVSIYCGACPDGGRIVKRKIKIFLSLVYTVIFVALASTGVLQSQAAEPESTPAGLNIVIEPALVEFEQFRD